MPSNAKKSKPVEAHLKVYENKSILVYEDGKERVFIEGKLTVAAKTRLDKIRQSLLDGYFVKIIEQSRTPNQEFDNLTDRQKQLLEEIVSSVTSEVGRAVVGMSVLQLCIKSICPDQSIRLHKGGGTGVDGFSWAEGIPMRVIDKTYITPILRKYGLLSLNADGIMMTRSLAENYPYSRVYKAAIRGARKQWLELIDLIDEEPEDSEEALRYLIVLLLNRTEHFKKLSNATITKVNKFLSKKHKPEEVFELLIAFTHKASYSARIFEIACHSFLQVLEAHGLVEGVLKPLSQMRSANKKHGNIGDIEIIRKRDSLEIFEAWDAKYGKTYLRDEIEELSDKLGEHSETRIVGFITDKNPELKKEITDRSKELEDLYNVKVYIFSFKEWIAFKTSSTISFKKIADEWLIAFTESLCLKRRELAPIDEPVDKWVEEFRGFIKL